MSRVKTFDSTGNAPGGRLFAGDLNAIQDQYADQTNLGQTVSIGTLVIGENALQLLRYGAGEARLSGAFRIDGIMRGLGGIYAGAFSTTQRDAIAAGFRPTGLVIFNTTNSRLEINLGTDAAPNWSPVSSQAVEVPVGAISDWPWAASSIPSWALLPFGQSVLKTDYPALNLLASAAGYVYGTDATHFSFPDYRGRVGAGKDDMGGTAANRITVAISGVNGATLGATFGAEGITLTTAQLPAHSHGITGSPSISEPPHVHNVIGINDIPNSGVANAAGDQQPQTSGPVAGGGTIGITVGAGSLGTSNTGSGSAHQNTQPSIIVNKIMRVL